MGRGGASAVGKGKIVLEVCAEGRRACVAAKEGGAGRLELCSALDVGGLTPDYGLVRWAVAKAKLPVHMMIRPRPGDFVYSDSEFGVMLTEIDDAKAMRVKGVVLGVLTPDCSVDVERTRILVKRAKPLQVTFHRAFDETPDVERALEDVISAGCDRVLTSGGRPTVEAGVEMLACLMEWSAARIEIAVGGGLRLRNAEMVARETKARHFHGSMTESLQGHGGISGVVDPEVVRRMLELLQNA